MSDPAELPWEVVRESVLKHAADGQHVDEVADLIKCLAWRYAYPPMYEKYFQFWEQGGFHLTPVHFYQPIPDTRTLDQSLWQRRSELVGIDLNLDVQLDLVRRAFPKFRNEYDAFPHEPTEQPHLYYFNNPQFGGTDALALYCMVRHFRPRLILEVGSGFSSRVSAQAALANGDTQLVCIDPYDDGTTRHQELRRGFPGLTEFIAEKVEDLPVDFFGRLGAGDFLFIDSSHVSRIGGDVNYLFLEVLPRLKPGVIVHVHDIFLPFEYPEDWVVGMGRSFNEQYLLQALLTHNPRFELLLCNHYLGKKHRSDLQATFPNSPWWGGGSFWMRRKAG
jgi:predicted O-methyltransferase YrrM